MLRKLPKAGMALIFLGLFGIVVRCNPDDDSGRSSLPDNDPLQPKPAITTTVAGIVIDESGHPLEDAMINVHGELAVTGPDGAFILPDIQVPGNRCVIQSTKEGYYTGVRALTPEENGQTETRIVMMGSPITHTFQASTGVNAVLSGGSEVRIPRNGLVDESGDPYSGPVNMSVRYLDPTAGNFGVLVPGGDMLAQREDQRTSVLYSYGILRVQMTDLSGEKLQLSSGTTSTLVMDIPVDQLATAPAKIPLWFFDEEKGVWQEEGSAVREGDKYVGSVKHFTDWNCDEPTEGATIIGRLVDCNKNPAYGIVEFGQTTSDPQSSTETGESDGRFERRVPDGVTITVVISDPLIISPLTQNERGKVIVIVPPLAPGQVYDVGDIQTFPCPAEVTASFKTSSEDQVEFLSFATENGYKPLYYPGGSMAVNLPPDVQVELTVYSESGVVVGKKFTTPAENESLDLGEIDLTAAAIDQPAVLQGQTVCYGEIETEGQITATWTDEQMNTKHNYASPESDGRFSVEVPANVTVELSSSTAKGTWTRQIETPSTPGEVLDIGTVELCENAAVSETSFRVTGAGFNNALFNIVSNQNMEQTNMGRFYPGSNITLAVIDDIYDELYMGIIFPGNTTGRRQQIDEVAITIERKTANTTVYFWGGLTEENTTLSLDITRYESPGGVIEGTFSGTFLVQDINKQFTGETVKITEGKFSVLRYPDVQ